MPVRWRFKEYRTHEGMFVFRPWFVDQPPEFRSEFDIVRRHLCVTEAWTIDDGAKDLEMEHAGLTELMIDIDVRAPGAARLSKRRFRPIGVRDVELAEFLILGACEKRARIYYPREAFNDATKHWGSWKKGAGTKHDLDV